MMLVRDPSKRATAAQVLAHPWIMEGGVAGDNEIEPEVGGTANKGRTWVAAWGLSTMQRTCVDCSFTYCCLRSPAHDTRKTYTCRWWAASGALQP